MTKEELNDLCDVFLEMVRQTDERNGMPSDPRVEKGIREVFALAMRGLLQAEIVDALRLTTASLARSELNGAMWRAQESTRLLRQLGVTL